MATGFSPLSGEAWCRSSDDLRILVWQWGRRGAGPRFALELARAMQSMPGLSVRLSLSRQAELLRGDDPPACDLPMTTYESVAGYLRQLATFPRRVRTLTRLLDEKPVDLAICAMPAALDSLMVEALRRRRVPFAVIVHDADPHPGETLTFRMALQRRLLGRADALIALSQHVAMRLRTRNVAGAKPLVVAAHPPFSFASVPEPRQVTAAERVRLLSFGRLLPYKGLDLLVEALGLLGDRDDFELRVVGSGPPAPELDRLRAMPRVSVENAWIPEQRLGEVLGWADALVLPHREASQSGVVAAALGAQRWVLATRVGGIPEQLRDEPAALLCEPTAAGVADGLRALLDRCRESAARPPVPQTEKRWRGLASAAIEAVLRAAPPPELPAVKPAAAWRNLVTERLG